MPTPSTLSAIALLAVPVAFFIPSPLSFASSNILNSVNPCLVPGTCVTPLQLNFLVGQLVDCVGPGPSETVNTLCIIKQLQNPNVKTIDYVKCEQPGITPELGSFCDEQCKKCLNGGDKVGGTCYTCSCWT
jgi:hypothetical protein